MASAEKVPSYRVARAVIAFFLALNLLAPLSYYLWRDDKMDERWAWRMFSPLRFTSCQVEFRVGADSRPIDTSQVFHLAWRNLAKRGRQAVIRGMADKLCRDHPGQPVRVNARCRELRGAEKNLSEGHLDHCARRP